MSSQPFRQPFQQQPEPEGVVSGDADPTLADESQHSVSTPVLIGEQGCTLMLPGAEVRAFNAGRVIE